MKEVLDLLIIGAGPAGITAGIYASRTWLNFKIIDKLGPGGQMIKTDKIDNYPGFPGISGVDLSLKLNDHLVKLGVNIEYEEAVNLKKNKEEIFEIDLKSGKKYYAKKVILATGVNPRKLNIENEEKFEGRGISYCATCDGYFYKDKVVAVVGKGDSAVTSAIYLSKIAKKVYVINKDGNFRDKGKLYQALINKENIEIKYYSKIVELLGEDKLEKIKMINYGKNRDTEEYEDIFVDGIFVLIGNIPESNIVKGVTQLSDKNEILTDKSFETSIKGLYAIGDVTYKSVRQILTAMADATIAIEEIEKNSNF